VRDDRIFPITRIIAALVVPFLVLAWVILYFFPDMSGERFAWRIQPAMTAVYMGAGYIGGAWLFIQVILGRRWLAAFAAVGFLRPDLLAAIWVWRLTPLTARVLSGWFALLAAGGIVIGRESRWSAWRVGLTSIGLWHVLVLVGAVVHRGDFTGGLINWYTASVALVLLGMAALAIRMARPIPV
jgi:hypothetical protein